MIKLLLRDRRLLTDGHRHHPDGPGIPEDEPRSRRYEKPGLEGPVAPDTLPAGSAVHPDLAAQLVVATCARSRQLLLRF